MPEFTVLLRDDALPHRFHAYRHDCEDGAFADVVDSCLTCWRLRAPAFREIGDTGFSGERITRLLNEVGLARLPETPVDDANVTRNPFITDITEVLALRLLAFTRPDVRFPHPRVLHKEARGLQHHGVDALGFEVEGDLVTLVMVEIMASVEAQHPPSTVRGHRDQLLLETMTPNPPTRLLDDLAYIHDECDQDEDKQVVNGLIAALVDGSLVQSGPQEAVAILIRPPGLFDERDWRPFRNSTQEFEDASLAAHIDFVAVECDQTLTDLMDRVKLAAAGGGVPGGG